MDSYNICLRLLEMKNKKAIKDSFQLKGVEVESLCSLKAYIVQKYGQNTGVAGPADFDLGYYGQPRNTRFRITNDEDLAKALHPKQGWVLLWMLVHEKSSSSNNSSTTTRKRGATSSNEPDACSPSKASCSDGM